MLLTTVPYICSKTASCWDVLENPCPPLHSLSLLFCWRQGNAKYYIFFLDTGFINVIWDHKSQKHKRVQNMEKHHLDITGIFLAELLSCSLRNKYKQLQLFSNYFFIFGATKPNIVAKFIKLKYERNLFSGDSIILLGLKKIYFSSQKGNDGKLRLWCKC